MMTLPFKPVTFVLAACVVIISALPVAAPTVDAAGQQQVLAVVNDTQIRQQDVARDLAQIRNRLTRNNTPDAASPLADLQLPVVRNLMDRELLYQHALQRHIKVRSSAVQSALKDFKATFDSRDQYRQFLDRSGQSEAELIARLEKGLILLRLLRKDVLRHIRVSGKEIQAFYDAHPELMITTEQVRVRHILIRLDPMADDAATEQAFALIQEIEQRLAQGDSFAALALQYSQCPSRANAGDLGYLQYDQLIPDFAAAAYSLAKGQVSQIVRTRLGFHLIQMMDRRPGQTLTLRQAREKISLTLRREKEQKALARYVAELRKNAIIEGPAASTSP